MKSAFDIFKELQKKCDNQDRSGFLAEEYPVTKFHKVAIDEKGRPCVLVSCLDKDQTVATIDLKNISVVYSQLCMVTHNDNNVSEDVYTLTSTR